MDDEMIAKVCHEVNAAVCRTFGDDSQKTWAEAETWQREAAVHGVAFLRRNPEAPASATHDDWAAKKRAAGWRYGPAKDGAAKTHPCLVDFSELPPDQRLKDVLFAAVVRELTKEGL